MGWFMEYKVIYTSDNVFKEKKKDHSWLEQIYAQQWTSNPASKSWK